MEQIHVLGLRQLESQPLMHFLSAQVVAVEEMVAQVEAEVRSTH
jgi:hypothetical protein